MRYFLRGILLLSYFLLSSQLLAERTGVVASDRAAFSLDDEVVLASELSRFIRQVNQIKCINPQALLLVPLGSKAVVKPEREQIKKLLPIYKLKKLIMDREIQSVNTLAPISKEHRHCLQKADKNRRYQREFMMLRRANMFLESRFQDRIAALDFHSTISRKIKHYIYH